MSENKVKRSHKRRHLKKLKMGAWRQERVEIRFKTGDWLVDSDILSLMIDDCYDIAEHFQCFLFGSFKKGEGFFAFHNEERVAKLTICKNLMVKKLIEYGCSDISVSRKGIDYE